MASGEMKSAGQVICESLATMFCYEMSGAQVVVSHFEVREGVKRIGWHSQYRDSSFGLSLYQRTKSLRKIDDALADRFPGEKVPL